MDVAAARPPLEPTGGLFAAVARGTADTLTLVLDSQAPVSAHHGIDSALAACSTERRGVFDQRLDRWWADLIEPLGRLYPDQDSEALAVDLVRRAATAFAERPEALHRLDHKRLLRPDWLQQPRMIGYAAYTERFAGSLAGIHDRLDYLQELGVTYLHLMPLLQPRDGDNDGGYALADYRSVRSDLGTIEDLREVADSLRERGISLVLDLVINHVAREHRWAQRARAGEQRYRDYFLIYPDREMPDQFEKSLPEVFPDFAPGNFTFDADCGGWVWTTFNEWQWDLNWANPQVLQEFVDIVLFLGNLGVEVLRLDAIAFLWKRMGTNCQNQPEVHDLTQVLRTVARLACPALAFKAEAIVGPRDLVQYLGVGKHVARVSDLAYHNSLMVQVWSMLAARNVVLARQALNALPDTPAGGTWITYARCHDDIGWAVDDGDAAAVGLDGHLHRAFLSDWYSGSMPDSWAEGLVFQENPLTKDRRISGTAASLAGLHTDDPAEPGATPALARVLLAHAIVYGWGGVPVLWSGDELATPNDPAWAEEPGHADDNRWAHRPRLAPDRVAARKDSGTAAGRLFTALARMGRVRAGLPQLHASVEPQIWQVPDDRVLVAVRRHASGSMVGIYNVTGEAVSFPMGILRAAGITSPWDALGERVVSADDPRAAEGIRTLAPYDALWIIDRP